MNVNGNTMYLQHFHDFYFLEAMKAGIMMAKSANPEWQFRHSVIRLESDVENALNHLAETMAKRIQAYIWAACLGEARHASQMVDVSIVQLSGSESRESVYNRFFMYNPTEEHLTLVRDIYAQKGWGTSYGGKNWQNCMEGLMLFGKVSDATFIDHAVDLEHNGGNIFTKSANATKLEVYDRRQGSIYYSASNLKSFCDFKFSHDILNSHHMGTIEVSTKVYNLVLRFGNIIRPAKVIKDLEPTLEWLSEYSVEWGDKQLTTRHDEDAPEVEERRYDMTCMQCGRGAHVDNHYHIPHDKCVCRDCYNTWQRRRHQIECENCGGKFNEDDTQYIDGEEQVWCDDCASDYKTMCEDCEKDFHSNNTTATEDNHILCDTCANEYICEACDEHFYNMREHKASHKVSLSVDSDGIFETFDDFQWIPVQYHIEYMWKGGYLVHSCLENGWKNTQEFVKTLKTNGAIMVNVTEVKHHITGEETSFPWGMTKQETITQELYTLPGTGLHIFDANKKYKKSESKYAVILDAGLWITANDGTFDTALEVAYAIKGMFDWQSVKSIEDWNQVPDDTKSKILKTINEVQK